ncbi:Tesmin/TSO1-like CXC domain [Sesbania bispinosa]|nr:Tesmin/TSO1-like CXC domain [Sesbania bispinosa]
MEEDKSSSSQPLPASILEPSFDELDSPTFLITPPRFVFSPLKQSPKIESDIIGAKNPNLCSEEPIAYFDEEGQVQYVEWTPPELKEANSFADAVLEDSPPKAIKRRRLHFEEAASDDLILPPLEQEPVIVSSSSEPISCLIPPQSGPKSSGSGILHLNALIPLHSETTDNELANVSADINVTSESPSIITEPFTNSEELAHDNNKAISPTDAGAGNSSEEFNQPGPDIYCVCFAEGLYCAESCTCEGCLNRPEYKEAVLNMREQIRSRKPFAFASKIVQDIPSNNTENDNMKTPSSARHRNGCRCPKSRCLRNYCECFEIKVGCSSACRCQGCQNPNGRKQGDHVAMEDAFSKEKDKEVAMAIQSELYDNGVPGFSPLTPPPLRCSNMRQSSVLITPMSGLKEVTRNPECLESSSSDGFIRKGRNFMWNNNNLPSFPPLTPCNDSKAKANRDGARNHRKHYNCNI